MRRSRRSAVRIVLLALLCTLALPQRPAVPAAATPAPALLTAGIVGDQSRLDSVAALPAQTAGAYLADSNVVQLPSGRLETGPIGVSWLGRAVLTVAPHAALTPGHRWLHDGRIPGGSDAERALARRALLDLRLLTRPGGAVAAAWYPGWAYVWPRDASWAAAAFAATDHLSEARQVLAFLQRVQRRDGSWEARYQLSGAGPVADGRRRQRDADGWVPWAVWFWYQFSPAGPERDRQLAAYWPMVAAAADAAVRSLGRSGLPAPAPDYWESRADQVTLGTAAPLLAGLHAAADLADRQGQPGEAARWQAAARRLDAGIRARFGRYGYPRTPTARGGADAAVTLLAPPFEPYDPKTEAAVHVAARRLLLPDGGILPGQAWRGDHSVAWTPETAFFALAAASSNEPMAARHWLDWLMAHRTALGALPEKVDAAGRPASVAPLAWTCAIVLLTLSTEDRALPVP